MFSMTTAIETNILTRLLFSAWMVRCRSQYDEKSDDVWWLPFVGDADKRHGVSRSKKAWLGSKMIGSGSRGPNSALVV